MSMAPNLASHRRAVNEALTGPSSRVCKWPLLFAHAVTPIGVCKHEFACTSYALIFVTIEYDYRSLHFSADEARCTASKESDFLPAGRGAARSARLQPQGFFATTFPFCHTYSGVPCMRAVSRARRAARLRELATAA
jgi:hypothetical protein